MLSKYIDIYDAKEDNYPVRIMYDMYIIYHITLKYNLSVIYIGTQ